MSLKIILPLLMVFLLFPSVAYAHCPLCTAATGSAIAVARLYGVDDLVMGTLIGGFLLSTTAWLNNMLRKRNKGKEYFPLQFYILVLVSLVTIILPLYFLGGALYLTNKLFLGIIAGSIVTLVAFNLHGFLRQTNGNKNHLPFQVIILTLVMLALTNVSFYLIGMI